MDGLEFFASVKKLATSVPSAILTACGSIEECLKAYSLGVFEYINEPFTPQELGKIVREALDVARTVK
jgi:DNA-binding NtrC family response regulator